MTDLHGILKENTNLTKRETNNLAKIIEEYDEQDELVYEIIGLLEQDVSLKDIIKDLNSCTFGFEGIFFQSFRKTENEQDYLLQNPPEIREGEVECPVCKQKRTVVVEMQTRSADEGFTYKTHCFNPKCKAVT